METMQLVWDGVPRFYNVTRNGVTVTVDLAKIPETVAGDLFDLFFKNKIGDAAAGAAGEVCGKAWDNMSKKEREAWTKANMDQVRVESEASMLKVRDNLYNGVWGAKRGPKFDAADGILRDEHFWDMASMHLNVPRKPKEKVSDWHARINAVFDESTAAKRDKVLEKAAAIRRFIAEMSRDE